MRSWCPAASASAASRARSSPRSYAREHRVPYLGICLGMQVATIEYARHVAGLNDANSTEFEPAVHAPGDRADRPNGRIATARVQKPRAPVQRPGRHDAPGRAELRREGRHPGAPDLRRRWSPSAIATATKPTSTTCERLQAAGLVISALTQNEQLTEMVELPRDAHPWFVGVQFHPEFKSTPWGGHPLFIELREGGAGRDSRNARPRRPSSR